MLTTVGVRRLSQGFQATFPKVSGDISLEFQLYFATKQDIKALVYSEIKLFIHHQLLSPKGLYPDIEPSS